MAIRTPFNQNAISPPPFNLGNIPASNLTAVPIWLQPGYVNGTTPEALPAIGNYPQTARDIISGVFPQKKR